MYQRARFTANRSDSGGGYLDILAEYEIALYEARGSKYFPLPPYSH